MKKLIYILFGLIVSNNLNAQLGNGDFETWENPLLHKTVNATATVSGNTGYVCADFDYNEPVFWSSINQVTTGANLGGVELVTESSTAQSGTKSLSIESKSISITAYLSSLCIGPSIPFTNVAPGLIVNGVFDFSVQTLLDSMLTNGSLSAFNPFEYPGTGEAIDFNPKSLSGYYQYSGAVNANTGEPDSCVILSGLKKNGVLIGYIEERMHNSATLTPFSFDYEHLDCQTPDTIVTVIISSNLDFEIVNNQFILNSDYTGLDGSVLLIDALEIDTISEMDLEDDFATVLLNEIDTVAILDNDFLCNGSTPIIDINPSNGMANINGNNEIVYTPINNFLGLDSMTYYICTPTPFCDTAVVYFSVVLQDSCQAMNDFVDINGGANGNFFPSNNDNNCGTDIFISTTTLFGVSVLETNNSITYTPGATYLGPDVLSYYICNPSIPSQCDTAKVFITVSIQDSCNANDDTRTINNGDDDTFFPSFNDLNCGSDVFISATPAFGTAVVESNNAITYTPDNTFSGQDQLSYYICNPSYPTQCDTAAIHYNVLSSISEIENSLIQISPNPTKDFLRIFVDVESEIIVTFINVLGEKILQDRFSKTKDFELQDIPNGIYFVSIETSGKKAIRKVQIIK